MRSLNFCSNEEVCIFRDYLKHPNAPDGSTYGYFYKDIEVEPKSIDAPWNPPTFTLQQWEFYWDSTLTMPINVEWRIPTPNDINKLVEHLGDIQRAYSPTYGIDMRYTGWYDKEFEEHFAGTDGWQHTVADCMFWLKGDESPNAQYKYWCFRSSSYFTGYSPNPYVSLQKSRDDNTAISIRLVADIQ